MSDARWNDPREYGDRDHGDERPRVYDERDRGDHDPRDSLMHDLDLPRGEDRELVVDRDRVDELNGEDSRTLAAAGTFRVVPEQDLHTDHDTLRHLRDEGLVASVGLGGDERGLTLTKEGRDLLDSHTLERDGGTEQAFHAGVDSVSESRVNALAGFGFTQRQREFLVTAMVHAGCFLERQYRAYTGTVRGQNSIDISMRDDPSRALAMTSATGASAPKLASEGMFRRIIMRQAWLAPLRGRRRGSASHSSQCGVLDGQPRAPRQALPGDRRHTGKVRRNRRTRLTAAENRQRCGREHDRATRGPCHRTGGVLGAGSAGAVGGRGFPSTSK